MLLSISKRPKQIGRAKQRVAMRGQGVEKPKSLAAARS